MKDFGLDPNNIVLHNLESSVYLLFLDISVPIVNKIVQIDNVLNVNIYIGEEKLELSKYQHILNKPEKLTLWSELQNILSFVKGFHNVSQQSICEREYEKAVNSWKLYMDSLSDDTENYNDKKFILDQMKLCHKNPKARRYNSNLVAFAYTIFMKSSACYASVYDSTLLHFPSVRHLKRLTSFLKLDQSTTDPNNVAYIKAKCDKLSVHERTVNLLLDEIHVKPQILYKGKRLTGFAENKENKEATTVQAFMICSIFSKYKEIVGLIPVCQMTAEDLFKLTMQALKLLEEAGFSVICVLSDNNRINRNMFVKLSGKGSECQTSINNPANPAKKLFLLFDPVHLVKSLRNNWLNQADFEKTFKCPKLDNLNETMNVSFNVLREIFRLEKDQIVKLAFKLNYKSLYPTNIERQNVNLALKVFDVSNCAALEMYAKQKQFVMNCEATSIFIKTVKKWWDIMNINHPRKGVVTRNVNSIPFRSVTDDRLVFLDHLIEWLKKWQSLKQNKR